MGAEVTAGALLASTLGGSLLSGGINALSSAQNTQAAIGASAAENEKQRNWAAEQASIANQRNMENWREQFGAQSEQALKMFDLYNEYNRPDAVVSRLMQAGFNPSAYFGSTGESGFGNLSAPSASPHDAYYQTPGMISFGTQPSTLDFTRAFEGISSAYEKFASGKEKSTNAQRTTSLLGAELRLLIEKGDNMNLMNAFQEMENEYARLNLPNRVERALQDTLLTASKVCFYESSSNYLDAQSLTESFKALNEELDSGLKGEELTRSKILTNYFEAQLKAEIQNKQASTNEFMTRSDLNAAEAKNVRFWTTLNNDEREYLVKNIHNDAAKRYQDARMSSDQRDLLGYAIEQARYANDQKEIKFWNELIMSDLRGASDILMDWTRVGAFKSLSDAQKQKVQNDKERFEYERNTYEDKVEWRDLRGNKHVSSGRKRRHH